jgi:DNA-binding LacI/PurR family transcriptional regulator
LKVLPKCLGTSVIDDEDAAFKAVEHLINIGKKRIAIPKESDSSNNISERRFQGYLRALKKTLFRNRRKSLY